MDGRCACADAHGALSVSLSCAGPHAALWLLQEVRRLGSGRPGTPPGAMTVSRGPRGRKLL